MPVLEQLQTTAVAAKDKATTSLNTYIITPEQRADLYSTTRTWCLQNPKLATFLATHLLLSTTPLLIFTLFALSTLLSSLAAALILALCFTAFCVGCAVLLLVPVLCFTTFAATCLWVWLVLGWWVFMQFGARKRKGAAAGEEVGWDGLWNSANGEGAVVQGKGASVAGDKERQTNGEVNGEGQAVTYAAGASP